MKTFGVIDCTNQAPSKHFGRKNISSTPLKNEKKKSGNLHKIGGAHLQYVHEKSLYKVWIKRN